MRRLLIALGLALATPANASGTLPILADSDPWAIIQDFCGNYWATGYNTGVVAEYDQNWNLIQSFNGGGHVGASSTWGPWLWYANEYGGRITQVYLPDNSQSTISFPASTIANTLYDPRQGVLYFASDGPNQINIYSPFSGTFERPILVDGAPRGLALTVKNRFLAFAVEDPSEIEVVNTRTRQVVKVIPTGSRPRDVTIKGRYVYSANYGAGTVTKANLLSGRVIATIPTGPEPRRIITYKNRVIVSNQGNNTISVIQRNRVVRTISVPAQPIGLSIVGRATLAVTFSKRSTVETFHLKTTPNK